MFAPNLVAQNFYRQRRHYPSPVRHKAINSQLLTCQFVFAFHALLTPEPVSLAVPAEPAIAYQKAASAFLSAFRVFAHFPQGLLLVAIKFKYLYS